VKAGVQKSNKYNELRKYRRSEADQVSRTARGSGAKTIRLQKKNKTRVEVSFFKLDRHAITGQRLYYFLCRFGQQEINLQVQRIKSSVVSHNDTPNCTEAPSTKK
jgi:hypothetical protein